MHDVVEKFPHSQHLDNADQGNLNKCSHCNDLYFMHNACGWECLQLLKTLTVLTKIKWIQPLYLFAYKYWDWNNSCYFSRYCNGSLVTTFKWEKFCQATEGVYGKQEMEMKWKLKWKLETETGNRKGNKRCTNHWCNIFVVVLLEYST